MYAHRILLLLLFLTFQHTRVSALRFDDIASIKSIGTEIYTLEDATNKLTIDDVRKNGEFIPAKQKVLNFGVSTSSFWLKFTITNATQAQPLLLQLAQPTMEVVELYTVDANGSLSVEKEGIDKPFSTRKYSHQNYFFELPVLPGGTITCYMKLKSSDQIMAPLSVGDSKALFEFAMIKDLIFGIFFGLMLVMFLYNLFIYFTVRDSSYIYYVAYIFVVCLMQGTLQGYAFRFIWPNNLWLAKNSIFILPSLAGMAAMIFAKVFLQTAKIVPRLDKGLIFLVGVFCFSIICTLLGNFKLSFGIMQLNTMLGSLYVLFLSYMVLRKGYRSAKFFLAAWSILLIGATIFVLKDFAVLPYNIITNSILEIGTATEVLLLSFALADKINVYRKEKEVSQALVLQALQENERIVKEQNVMLEKKVDERTYELNMSYGELNKAMNNLKEAQTQLVESEKMASLGQLTAGIAHEINNPINFVTSNVKPLNRDVRILLETIDTIEQIAISDTNSGQKKKEIENYKLDIDYDYLKEEIDQLLNGIGDGASRTAEIVKGLRIFSRLDEDDLKKADLNEGLDSTLVITNNLLGSSIKLVKNYSNLSLIECYPGKLNQVFLNIISNAIYAIKKNFDGRDGGVLTITTTFDDEFVYVKIADNGTGMDENTKRRLFEPFFTTKDVGEGTGLGMSIAYNTINKHNGQIIVNSEVGVGTEFILKLPLMQK